ncbi:hypothetical protein C0J52_12129 [Blattella germanica]|nr:hypothetical protein C0J52_12129 [Blattella germanica]
MCHPSTVRLVNNRISEFGIVLVKVVLKLNLNYSIFCLYLEYNVVNIKLQVYLFIPIHFYTH